VRVDLDEPVKADTTEDVRKDLIRLLARFKSFAKETAAAPDVSEEHKRWLAQDVEGLCGSEEHVEPPALPDTGAVMRLIEIIEEYEAFRLWLVEAFQRLSPEDQAALTRRLRPFSPNSAVDLRSVLSAAFGIGIFARNPIQKLREMRHARANRHPKSGEKNATILKMYGQGRSTGKIAQAVGIGKDAVKNRIRGMIADGKLQRRSRRSKTKKGCQSDVPF
jgi:hypothetical protein